jgi:hypothetical protein
MRNETGKDSGVEWGKTNRESAAASYDATVKVFNGRCAKRKKNWE